jgi:hypothetical protein
LETESFIGGFGYLVIGGFGYLVICGFVYLKARHQINKSTNNQIHQ